MDVDVPRKLDTAIPASIDHVTLNNQIVGMRKTVKRTKVQLINRMVQRVRQLKNSRGNDLAVAKKQRKAERILQEIQVIKNLNSDKVSKYALANTSTVTDVANLPPSSEVKAMVRYANHKILQELISKFREKHSDWKALAAYMLTKNTGRRFKKKATKEKTTAKAAEMNKKAGEGLMETFLHQKIGDSADIDVNKSEGVLKKKNKQRTQIKATGTCLLNSLGEIRNSEQQGNPVENLMLRDNEELSEDSKKSSVKKPVVQKRHEMVVKLISLDSIDEDTLEFSKEKFSEDLISDSTKDSNDDQISLFLKVSDKKSKTAKRKKDSFFMCSDEDMDSGNESNDNESVNNDSDSNDDEEDVEDNLAQIQKGKLAMRSTFLGSLTDNKKEKIWAGKRLVVRQGRDRGLEYSTKGRQHRSNPGNGGKTSHRDHPYIPQKPAAKQTKQYSVDWKQNSYEKATSSQTSASSGRPLQGKFDKPEEEEKLHPSWQASKQRKQQASQIQAFQGTKITFSDDD